MIEECNTLLTLEFERLSVVPEMVGMSEGYARTAIFSRNEF